MFGTDHLLTTLWRRRGTFLLTFVAMMAAAAAVTFSLPKVYSTVAYLWVTPGSQARSDFEATQTSQVLTRTYAELLQTRPVADAVAAALPYDATGAELQGSVKASPVSQSQLLAVEAEAKSPERAQQLANTYAKVFRDEAQRFESEGTTRSRLTIATPATLPDSPSRPKPALYLMVAAFLAALVAAAAALLREGLDKRLRLDSAATEVLGLPILGRLAERRKPLFGRRPDTEGALRDESLRLIVANLSLARPGEMPRSLAFASPAEHPGRTLCAAELAVIWAHAGMEVLLVDADFTHASLSRTLGLREGRGLSSCLAQSLPVEEVAYRLAGSSLAIVAAGPEMPNPSGLLEALTKFDARAREAFDLVVYDTSSLSSGGDAPLVASAAQASILVMSPESTERNMAGRALGQLDRARAEILGVVISAATGRGAYDALTQLFTDTSQANGRPAHGASREETTPSAGIHGSNGREYEPTEGGRRRFRDRLGPRRPDR
jgi:capsular exopolysaccharide synthesis family protein